jgi:hypothetical protein
MSIDCPEECSTCHEKVLGPRRTEGPPRSCRRAISFPVWRVRSLIALTSGGDRDGSQRKSAPFVLDRDGRTQCAESLTLAAALFAFGVIGWDVVGERPQKSPYGWKPHLLSADPDLRLILSAARTCLER